MLFFYFFLHTIYVTKVYKGMSVTQKTYFVLCAMWRVHCVYRT